jgi:hypothetical protein
MMFHNRWLHADSIIQLARKILTTVEDDTRS